MLGLSQEDTVPGKVSTACPVLEHLPLEEAGLGLGTDPQREFAK